MVWYWIFFSMFLSIDWFSGLSDNFSDRCISRSPYHFIIWCDMNIVDCRGGILYSHPPRRNDYFISASAVRQNSSVVVNANSLKMKGRNYRRQKNNNWFTGESSGGYRFHDKVTIYSRSVSLFVRSFVCLSGEYVWHPKSNFDETRIYMYMSSFAPIKIELIRKRRAEWWVSTLVLSCIC